MTVHFGRSVQRNFIGRHVAGSLSTAPSAKIYKILMLCRKPLAVTIAALLGIPAAWGQGTPTPASASAATAAAGTAPASATSSDIDSPTGDAIVITGSNIRRTDYEGPQTVKVIDRASIDRSGVRTVTELIQRLPENAGGFTETTNNGLSFSPGASSASLRGLGISSTLVLINGRRVSPFSLPQEGTDSFVDINSIPLSAVERVEILKEGASAIYGSDAIAGVINIILRENYTGAETETHYGNTTRDDASEYRESFLSGFQNERFHLLVTGNYFHRNPIAYVDRSYASTADHRDMGGSDLRSSFGNPGTIFNSSGTLAIPRGSNGKLLLGDFKDGFEADGQTLRNRYDFNKVNQLSPETDRWGGLITFGYNLTPHLEVFGEGLYQNVRTKTYTAPTPADVIVPATNPFNPFGEDVEAIYRSVETGLRRHTIKTDSYRFVGGLKVKDLPYNWTAEASFLYSETDSVDFQNGGFLSQYAVDKALAQTDPNKALNVFGEEPGINSRRLSRSLLTQTHNSGVSYIDNTEVKASGDIFNLPSGAISVALGGEYRHEFLSETFSEPADYVVSSGGTNSLGERDVQSLFVEGRIPILGKKWTLPFIKELELTIAERYDEYSDFGESTKPKFGFKLKPFDGLIFRGAYAEGFRAPSLPQLFSGQITAFDTVVNPRTGQVGDVSITTGGDPNLKPENSYSYFFGTIIEPKFAKGLSIEVDYFNIEQRNLIAQPSTQDVVDGTAGGTVSYNAANQITGVTELFTNLGTVKVEGVDFDINYKLNTKIGTFTFDSSSSYLFSYRQSATAGAPLQNLTDSYSIPEFKIINSLFYKKSGFETGVTVNYIDSYDDSIGNDKQTNRTVGSWTTVDLQLSYEWIFDPELPASTSKDKDGGKTSADTISGVHGWHSLLNHAKLTLGCLNVGDAEPPFSNVEEGYDPQTADPTGRFLYVSMLKKFW